MDSRFAGNYRADGGCLGSRCHPWCTPGTPDAGKGASEPCCLDDECASGQCQGPVGTRVCATRGNLLGLGQGCSDATDCNINTPAFCEVRSQLCASTIASTLGRDGGLLVTFLSSGNQSNGSLLPDFSAASCALPEANVGLSANTSPCCYDRDDAGTIMSCLQTGTCVCPGNCNATRDYTCPF